MQSLIIDCFSKINFWQPLHLTLRLFKFKFFLSFHQLPTKRTEGAVYELLQRSASPAKPTEHGQKKPKSLPKRWTGLGTNQIWEQSNHHWSDWTTIQRNALHFRRGYVVNLLLLELYFSLSKQWKKFSAVFPVKSEMAPTQAKKQSIRRKN